jgi:UDP-N-acetylmuramoyl-L-alanyl-D-glutamate--2,6-diaminopimelate ligase
VTSPVTLPQLGTNLNLHHLSGALEVQVDDLCCDSRKVSAKSCFVAVKGHSTDGHDYVKDALSRGAGAIIVQEGRESAIPADSRASCYSVADTRHALGVLSREFWSKPDRKLELVAVTGTNGKTTVTHLVRDILRAAGRRCGLIGTIQYDTGHEVIPATLTTPDPCDFFRLLAEMCDEGLEAGVFEASSHALDQERIGEVEVDVAAFTNLSREHLDYHPDLQSYLAAKRRLLERLEGPSREKSPGRAVVFVDDETLAAAPWPAQTLRVGRREGSDLRLLDSSIGPEGSTLRVGFPHGESEFQCRLLGGFNVDNALVALGCGYALGLSLDELRGGLAAAAPVRGRMEPVELKGGPLVLVDYAHTPDGLEKALWSCREIAAGRLHVVFGCGGDRDRGKRALMAAAVMASADEIYLTLDNPRTEDPARIFADAESGMTRAYQEGRARTIEDRGQAIALAIRSATPKDVVLIAGKGHETYQILGQRKLAWDDREAARKAWTAEGGS